MVPTFPKGVQSVPSASRRSKTPPTSSTGSLPSTAATTTTTASVATPSLLFMPDTDDLGAAEWGEDDEWVKGI